MGPPPEREGLDESKIEVRALSAEIVAVREALDALAVEDAGAAKAVKLRYFVGMSIADIADA